MSEAVGDKKEEMAAASVPANEVLTPAGGDAKTKEEKVIAAENNNTLEKSTSSEQQQDEATSDKKRNNNNRKRKQQFTGNRKKKEKIPWWKDRRGKNGGGRDASNNEEREKAPKRVRKNGGIKDWGGENSPNTADRDPNPGSYARQEQRDLFSIQLPVEDNDEEITSTEQQQQQQQQQQDEKGDKEEQQQTKHPKRKVALLIAFIGTAYGGMQMNEKQRTIQAELELALYKAKLIVKTNFGYPFKYSWSNSARTDRGVHSCANVCSCKILFDPSKTTEDIRNIINEQLPEDIRVLDVVRTTRTFCAKTSRGRVRYQYMLPSYILFPRDQLPSTFTQAGCTITTQSDDLNNSLLPDQLSSLQQNKKLMEYRASSDQLQLLRDALEAFHGTHSFHNYTKGMTSKDASASRFIVSFDVGEPVVTSLPLPSSISDKNDNDDDDIKPKSVEVEWIPTQVVGQSFLLNQIRKMISMAVDVARGNATINMLHDSLSKSRKMRTSIAPAQGLFLDMSYYDNYNNRVGVDNPLDWVQKEETPAVKRWKQFKEERVMKHIMRQEMENGEFLKYLFLQEFIFDRNHYLPIDDDDDDQGKKDDETAVATDKAGKSVEDETVSSTKNGSDNNTSKNGEGGKDEAATAKKNGSSQGDNDESGSSQDKKVEKEEQKGDGKEGKE